MFATLRRLRFLLSDASDPVQTNHIFRFRSGEQNVPCFRTCSRLKSLHFTQVYKPLKRTHKTPYIFSQTVYGLLLGVLIQSAQAAPSRIDLRSQQTPLRDQGSRNTCITFSVVAALEAAYQRAGYGSIDLSEQFLNHMGKMSWLHANWDEILAGGRDAAESQVGAFGGGGGVYYTMALANGVRIVEERLMPYRNAEYSVADHPNFAYPWAHPVWKIQRNQNDFNLSNRFLPRAALTTERTYRVRAARKLSSARDTGILEDQLAAGREVVWDMEVANPSSTTWQPCADPAPEGCIRGAHSMLLVGYDRSSSDPRQHVFIAKNSWGSTAARSDGFTYLSYGYVRRHGIAAAVIDSIYPPERWDAAYFVGRWNLNFDGWRGQLDAYHIPGIAQYQLSEFSVTTADRRLGSYYDPSGNAYRVNGFTTGNRLNFNIASDTPMLRWDDYSSGRRFTYFIVQSPTLGTLAAGTHVDPDGRWYGGYMRQEDFLPSGTDTPRPFALSSWVRSRWDVHFANKRGTLSMATRDDSFLNPAERAANFGVIGSFRQSGAGSDVPAQVLVNRVDPAIITVRVPSVLPSSSLGGQLSGVSLQGAGRASASVQSFQPLTAA
ncbi:MAG: hypothetical protein ACK6BG_09025 [Cyanobacteriota bacterium]